MIARALRPKCNSPLRHMWPPGLRLPTFALERSLLMPKNLMSQLFLKRNIDAFMSSFHSDLLASSFCLQDKN